MHGPADAALARRDAMMSHHFPCARFAAVLAVALTAASVTPPIGGAEPDVVVPVVPNVIGFMVMQSHPDFTAFAREHLPASGTYRHAEDDGVPVSMLCLDNDDGQGLACALDVFPFDPATLTCGARIGSAVNHAKGLSYVTVLIPRPAYDGKAIASFCVSVTPNHFNAGHLSTSTIFSIAVSQAAPEPGQPRGDPPSRFANAPTVPVPP